MKVLTLAVFASAILLLHNRLFDAMRRTAAASNANAPNKKGEENFKAAEKMQTEADAAMRNCYNERVKSQAFFTALVKQARELVKRIK